MEILTIMLFLVYTWGLGFSVTYLLKRSDNFFERNIMNIGIGMGIFVILGVFFNMLRIPVDWKIFLLLSIIVPIYSLAKNYNQFNFNIKLTKSNLYIGLVLLLFLGTFYMYHTGAFAYPYMEDDDPWQHAKSIKYVSVEKDLYETSGEQMKYLDPYPPGYAMMFGVLHQTSDSLSWTMKFFNALIISLSIFFFYFFAADLIKDKKKALFSTFVLASIPCFLSHFIWSFSLIIPLFLVCMYCYLQVNHDKRWLFLAGAMLASIPLTQPSMAVKLWLMVGIYFAGIWLYEQKFPKKELISVVVAVFLVLMWYGPLVAARGLPGTGDKWGEIDRPFEQEKGGKWFLYKGSADRVYTFDDFFIAKENNMINNPIGIGVVISLLLFFSVFYIAFSYKKILKKESFWVTLSFAWFIFAFLGVMGASLPIQFMAFRFWMLVAITSSLLAAAGMWFLISLGKKVKIPAIILLVLVVLGIIFTSASQKYTYNTANWPPGVKWSSYDEVLGASWLKTLPANTKVFGLCSEQSAAHILGFDMFDCFWCDDTIDLRQDGFNMTAERLNSELKKNGYQLVVVDSRCPESYGINETNDKVQGMAASSLFQPVKQAPGIMIFKVV